LLLSVSIPHAFDSRGLLFAGAFVAMQVGRTLFFLWAVRSEHPNMRRNFQRILVWYAVASACWLLGGSSTHDARFAWWALALAIETIAPIAFFWVPGLGRSTIEDWDVEGAHLAERCALFVIIALGESLLVTGATFAGLKWNVDALLAFFVAVSGTILLWWIYFDTGARRATKRIEHASDPGREARSAYTYAHAVIVAGILACAVADEVVLLHPHHAEPLALGIVLGGPMLYLLGIALFKWITNDRRAPPLSHLVGLAMFGLLAWPAARGVLSPLHLSMAAMGVLLVVAVWESLAIRRGIVPESLAIDED